MHAPRFSLSTFRAVLVTYLFFEVRDRILAGNLGRKSSKIAGIPCIDKYDHHLTILLLKVVRVVSSQKSRAKTLKSVKNGAYP